MADLPIEEAKPPDATWTYHGRLTIGTIRHACWVLLEHQRCPHCDGMFSRDLHHDGTWALEITSMQTTLHLTATPGVSPVIVIAALLYALTPVGVFAAGLWTGRETWSRLRAPWGCKSRS